MDDSIKNNKIILTEWNRINSINPNNSISEIGQENEIIRMITAIR